MSYVDELRLELKIIQTMFDEAKKALSRAYEFHKELNDYDPEYNAEFTLMSAEADFYVIEVEKKIESLKNEIKRLESQDQDN